MCVPVTIQWRLGLAISSFEIRMLLLRGWTLVMSMIFALISCYFMICKIVLSAQYTYYSGSSLDSLGMLLRSLGIDDAMTRAPISQK
jgi:hypothetical protein